MGKAKGNSRVTRNRTVASLSALLWAVCLDVVCIAPASAATVSIINFRGAWSPTTTYGAGLVAIDKGTGDGSLGSHGTNVLPGSGTTAWAILHAPEAAGASGPGGAAITSCSTNIAGPATIHGDVVVPPGGHCSLGWVPPYATPCCNPPIPSGYGIVQVTGKVMVGTGASLVVGLNSKIVGGIQAKGCNFVELVSEGNEEVGGDVQICNCTGNPAFLSTGTGSAIHGSFQCLNNSGPCTIESATVGGSAHFIGNVNSSASRIEGNRIHGNLLCLSNSPVPANGGHANTVSGSEQGQCVGF
jgi:hypothetical protein